MSNFKVNEKGAEKLAVVLEENKDAISEKVPEYDGNAVASNAIYFVDGITYKNGKIIIGIKNSSRLECDNIITINTEKLRTRTNEVAKILKNKNYAVDKAVKKSNPKKVAEPVADTVVTEKPTPKPKGDIVSKKKVLIKKAKA